MVKIVEFKKRDNVIPIDFGDFKLEFVANDESLKMLTREGEKLSKKATELQLDSETQSTDKVLDGLKDLTCSAWDSLFGEGTFEKVYEFAGESVLPTIGYFSQVVVGVNEEYKEQLDTDALSKYLEE